MDVITNADIDAIFATHVAIRGKFMTLFRRRKYREGVLLHVFRISIAPNNTQSFKTKT